MRCVVLYCNTNDQNERYKNEIFFPFPQDSNMCKVWKYACGRGEDFQADKARICERHFDKTDFEKHVVRFDYTDKGNIKKYRHVQLKSYAIPTLDLPKLSGNVRHCILFPKRDEPATNAYLRNTGEGEEAPIRTYQRIRKKCAISNCNQQSRVIYNFPHYQHQKNLFMRWKSLCENEEIKRMQPEDVNLAYGICDAHFEREIVIIPELLPTVDLPGPKAEKKDEPCEPKQLCRLCFSPGNVDLLTFKYYKMLLRDIVKNFIPIEIKRSDPSTLICENCKSEVIHFHNFLLKSMRVNEYFEAISKEGNNSKESLKGGCIELIRIDDGILEDTAVIEGNQETTDAKTEVIEQENAAEDNNNADISQDDAIVIEDDSEPEKEEKEPPSLLWKCLMSDPKKPAKDVVNVDANQNVEETLPPLNYVPDYVLKYFHTYVKTSQKVEKEKMRKKTNKISKDKLPETAEDVSGKRIRKKDNKADTIICIHCNKIIDSLDEFNEHCKSENHDPIFRCSDCNRMFKTQSDLDDHTDDHKKSNSGMCDRCGKQFTKRDGLYTHINNVHNRHNLKHECSVCKKKFLTKYRLKLHTRLHTNERPYCCEHCGAVFTMLANLRNHQTIHSDYKPHVCLICNKGFRRRNKLAIHLTKHTDERKYSCDKCGISYKRQLNLTRHNRKHHPNPNEIVDETPRKCPVCDFTCNYAGKLRVHMLKEHKPYTCTICGMNFKSYQPYYNHKFKHFPRKKKYVCICCNKRFINSTLLNVHMVVHTGRKDYECEFCKKKFSQRPHLQSHLLIHTGEKPYKCKFCTKSFAHLSTLVVHERIHTGETPYVCQFCNKGFGHLTNYKKHVFSQHGVVMPKQRDYSSVMKIEPEENEDKNAIDMIPPIIEFVDGGIKVDNSLDAGDEIFTEMSI